MILSQRPGTPRFQINETILRHLIKATGESRMHLYCHVIKFAYLYSKLITITMIQKQPAELINSISTIAGVRVKKGLCVYK